MDYEKVPDCRLSVAGEQFLVASLSLPEYKWPGQEKIKSIPTIKPLYHQTIKSGGVSAGRGWAIQFSVEKLEVKKLESGA